MSIVLVCGGRDYNNQGSVYGHLDWMHQHRPISCIIHGGATGADELAAQWARTAGIEVKVYPALWSEHGRMAGPIRNQLMLNDGKPDVVLAFPGGRGTADMVRRAMAAENVNVVQV